MWCTLDYGDDPCAVWVGQERVWVGHGLPGQIAKTACGIFRSPYFVRTSYSRHLHIYRIKLTANCILRRLAAEDAVINYLSRHFDHCKISVAYRLGVQLLHRIFDVPLPLRSASAYIYSNKLIATASSGGLCNV